LPASPYTAAVEEKTMLFTPLRAHAEKSVQALNVLLR
jgi:hypothetical protein